ncbi:hypothetical protein AB6A40_006965 [Gnathostoma spinigerum]|uniref:Metalloendopeptidase n=1 Tax=Gnathostoma spinigerum TaxID=75299 RepID=A0ABD6EKH1_9BILA
MFSPRDRVLNMLLPIELLFAWTLIFQCSSAEYNIPTLIDRTIPEGPTFLTAADFEHADNVSIDFDSLGIKVSDLDDSDLYQGDIVLEEYQKKSRIARSASLKTGKWNTPRIPYELSIQFGKDARAVIAAAIKEFERHTCIRFVKRLPSDADYIYIHAGKDCHSSLGHTGREQRISLGERCLTKGIVIHEIMHALSFIHEQSRPDRDAYVKVNFDAVKDEAKHNFELYTIDRVDLLGVPYSYNSIMHYGSDSFSKDQRPTIIPLKSGAEFMGQRFTLSASDVAQVRRLYGCKNLSPYPEPNFRQLMMEDLKKNQVEFCENANRYCDFNVNCNDMKDYIRCPKTCRKCDPSKMATVEKCDGSSNLVCIMEGRSCSEKDTDLVCPRSCGKCRPDEIPKIEKCERPYLRCVRANCNDYYEAVQCGLTCRTLKCW